MVRLREVVDQNPWWKTGSMDEDPDLRRAPKIRIPRRYIDLEKGNIYTIEGPRRSGKTLWMKESIGRLISYGEDPKSIGYFSVDRIISRRELRSVLDFFIDREVNFIFLDEVQSVPGWAYEVKRLWETYGKDIVIVLTGSPLTLREEEEPLLGRGIEGNRYYIEPVSFRRFLEVYMPDKMESVEGDPIPYIRELRKAFFLYLEGTGFPRCLVERLTKGIVSDQCYLEIREQVRKRADSADDVEVLSRYLARNLGSRMSLLGISQYFGKDINWAKRKIEFLKKRRVLFEIRAVEKGGRVRKRGEIRKFYFIDHGFPLSLLSPEEEIFNHIQIEMLTDDIYLGHLMEQVVAQHLRKTYGDVYFSLNGKKERDFYIPARNEYLEVKKGGGCRGTLCITLDDYGEGEVPIYIYLLQLSPSPRFL